MTDRLLRPAEQAEQLGIARSTLLRLVRDEGLPAVILSGGNGRRRVLRFRSAEVDEWIAGRQERQARATLDGPRFTRGAQR